MPDRDSKKDYAQVELTFSPNVQLVSVVRTFVKQFYHHVVPDSDLTSRLALAAHEMLENAVKYWVDDTTRLLLAVQRHENEVEVRIMTRNRANAETITGLHEIFTAMRNAKDPVGHYQDLMRQATRRTFGSGLGLGRIRAEALLALDYTVKGDIVELLATGRHPLVNSETQP